MTIQIITDTTSDIPPEIAADLPITILPLHVRLNNIDYLDTVNLTREQFYETLPNSSHNSSTAAPSPGKFIETFKRLMDNGAEAIFSIHISRTLSAILESAQIAAEQFDGIQVYPIDSGNLSMALGLIVVEAAKAAKEGKGIQAILEVLNSAIHRAYAYAKLDTIDYLLRGGRINSIQHSVISLLGIRPILKMHEHVSKMEVARTKSKAFEKVLHRALEIRPRSEYFGITHANVPDQANELIQILQQHYPDLPKPWVTEVNPALGFHVGPGALCINWIEKEGLDEEPKKGLNRWLH
ncbi:MAG: DegV family protein [Anaerolineaceae bacterium]|nr:DegV family protein [Anaerolineaceae bacterium]